MTIKNMESFQKKLDKYLNQNPSKNAKKAIGRGVMLVKGTAQESITAGGKSGIEYQKYNPRRSHRASASGEFPASDTGFLANNIVTKLSSDGLSGEVTSRADYSQFLEFGTSKMGARPFMQPSLEENRPKIRARVRRLLG